MAQRAQRGISDAARRHTEHRTFLRELGIRRLWEPAPAPDDGLADVLRPEGFTVVSTTGNFLTTTPPTDDIDCVLTNPPYGQHKRAELAEAFIRHAMTLIAIRHTVLLLAVDFDSAKRRTALFGNNLAFASKITLLGRIKCFPDRSRLRVITPGSAGIASMLDRPLSATRGSRRTIKARTASCAASPRAPTTMGRCHELSTPAARPTGEFRVGSPGPLQPDGWPYGSEHLG